MNDALELGLARALTVYGVGLNARFCVHLTMWRLRFVETTVDMLLLVPVSYGTLSLKAMRLGAGAGEAHSVL